MRLCVQAHGAVTGLCVQAHMCIPPQKMASIFHLENRLLAKEWHCVDVAFDGRDDDAGLLIGS